MIEFFDFISPNLSFWLCILSFVLLGIVSFAISGPIEKGYNGTVKKYGEEPGHSPLSDCVKIGLIAYVLSMTIDTLEGPSFWHVIFQGIVLLIWCLRFIPKFVAVQQQERLNSIPSDHRRAV